MSVKIIEADLHGAVVVEFESVIKMLMHDVANLAAIFNFEPGDMKPGCQQYRYVPDIIRRNRCTDVWMCPAMAQYPKGNAIQNQGQAVAPEIGVDADHLQVNYLCQLITGQVQIDSQVPLTVVWFRIIEISKGNESLFHKYTQYDAMMPEVLPHEVF